MSIQDDLRIWTAAIKAVHSIHQIHWTGKKLTVHNQPVSAVLCWADWLPTFCSTMDCLQHLLPSLSPPSLQLLCFHLPDDTRHTLFLCSSAAKSLSAALLTDLCLHSQFPPSSSVRPAGDLYNFRAILHPTG
eukprot:542882-Rhodomonas_salina.2